MAEDDPFDYAFGQFGDQNPPGTMTGLGLGPNDPLYDWGSNMKPADLMQYMHDPEGFKQNMINQGVPPPDHHYVATPTGLQAVDPQSGQPVIRTEGGRIKGNLSDYLAPTAAQAVAPPGQPRSLAYMDPGGGFGQSPEAEALPESGKGTPPSPGQIGGALLPPPITPQRPPPLLPKLRNPSEVPEGTTPLPRARPGGGEPAELPPVPETEARPGSTPAERAKEKKEKKAEVEPLSSEAMSDFAKSLQGVKMPQRPAWQPMGAPAVRSPVGIQPQIQGLLAAIGQGRPSPQQVALMRLLGRA
jgi:hypothetical protein